MFDVVLLYETWKQIDIANRKLLELLRKIDTHPAAYHNDESFQEDIARFNSELAEVVHRVEMVNGIIDRFDKDILFKEKDEYISYFGNRRIIQRRASNERRTHERRSFNQSEELAEK